MNPERQQRKIVMTGIAGRLGQLVARRLHRLPDVHVIGIDRRPFPGRPRDVEHVQVDLRSKKARDVFRAGDVSALVHLGVMHDPRSTTEDQYSWNVSGTVRLLEYCKQYEVPKVVLLSSATCYGPQASNPQFLTEDAPLLAAQFFPAARTLIDVDMLFTSFFWKARKTATVVLRPVHIVGSVHNAPSNYLRLPLIPKLLGFDPMVQLVHELDVVEAVMCALAPGARGVYNVAGPGELPLSAALAELGKPVLPVPHPLFGRALDLLWRGKLTSFPAPELDHIRYVCMVDDRRARAELGYRPRHSLRETVRAPLEHA